MLRLVGFPVRRGDDHGDLPAIGRCLRIAQRYEVAQVRELEITRCCAGGAASDEANERRGARCEEAAGLHVISPCGMIGRPASYGGRKPGLDRPSAVRDERRRICGRRVSSVRRPEVLPVKKVFRVRRYLAAALLVVLLLPCASSLTSAAGAPPKTPGPSAKAPGAGAVTAILIVAQDAVADPNFGGSIVVVMNNLGPAPVGLIINRPTPLTVSRFFPKLKRLAQ